jgi:drug/metabolite transporter (DMT)-like permease
VLVAGAGVIFSFGPLTFRAAEESTEWQFLLYRSASAAVAMALLLLFRFGSDGPRRILRAEWRHVAAGVLLAGMFTLFVTSLSRTTAATVLFLQSAAPFTAALFAWIWLGERLRRATLLAMIAAAAGITIMVATGLEAGSTTGVILAAILPVGLGLYTVLIRSAGSAADPAVPAFIAGLAAMVVAGVIVSFDGGFGVSLRDGLMAVISGGVLIGVGLPLFNLGHRAVPAAEVTLLLMTEVVLAPLWVWIWPGETPSVGTLVGGAIVISALAGWAMTSDRSP